MWRADIANRRNSWGRPGAGKVLGAVEEAPGLCREQRRRQSGKGRLGLQRILGFSLEQMEATRGFEQGIFIFNLKAYQFS